MISHNRNKVKLGNIAKIGDGAHISLKRLNEGILYLTSKNFKSYGLDLSKVDYISQEDFNRYFKSDANALTKPTENDLLLSIIGSIGEPYIVKKGDLFGLSSSVSIIRSNPDIVYYKYLFFYMKSHHFQSNISQIKGGVAQSYLSLSMIKELDIILPPLPTQQRIANILSTYDDLIENNTRRIKILEEQAQLIYKEWFVKFQFPGHEDTKMIDSGTEFGEIPERWKVKRVEEMIQKIPTGKKYEKKTVFEKGNIPVLDQGKKGLIGYHNDEPGVIASKEDPIIVFANHTCYQNIIMHPFSTIQNVFGLKPNEEYPSDIYRLHYATKDLIELNDYKGHFPEYIGKKVLYPGFDITNIFGNKISSTIKLVYELQKQNQNLKETRDMLIPKLVSGEVEV